MILVSIGEYIKPQ